MLPDTPDVEKVLFGRNGVAEGVSPSKIVVDMSSISPVATRQFAARLAEKGVELLDAPVSGGQIGAEQATLSIMCGGKPEVFDRVKPLLETMGKRVTLIGGSGDGQIAKLANQIMVTLQLQGVIEALLLASKMGADVNTVRGALMGGFASSRMLEHHGKVMAERNFQPGFRVRLLQKDLNNVLETARHAGVCLPGTAKVQQLLNSLSAHGGADLDTAALVTVAESLASHELG
jgi:2-hydroxy-3-oxopropionate reductase